MKNRKMSYKQIVPGVPSGVTVLKGNIEYALRSMKKMVKDDGRLKAVRDRKEFKKPSDTRRRQIEEAKFRQRKEDRNNGF